MTFVLGVDDLRAVAAFAAECAEAVLGVFEADRPDDVRPRAAIDAARAFAQGGERGKALRDTAWAALKAAGDADAAGKAGKAGKAGDGDAGVAARAAMAAAGAAYLHPLAQATQVKHILGAAAYAARATELVAGDDPTVGAEHIAQTARRTPPAVVAVLVRYPRAPDGGGRVGELTRLLDAALRGRP